MRRLNPTAAYALSAAAHLGVFGWAWSLPAHAHRSEKVDVADRRDREAGP